MKTGAVTLLTLLTLLTFASPAATVTGNLTDICTQPLNTKLVFTPTNEACATPTGLDVGGPRLIDTTNGGFSICLQAGPYTVTTPALAFRRPFCIYVPVTNGTLNITNLLTACPCTNSFAIHANLSQVAAWSTNGERSLIDTNISIPANTLRTGGAVRLEAFGEFVDAGNNFPNATFNLKLGATTLVTIAKPVTTANWHLSAAITFRSVGPAAVVIASLAVIQDNLSLEPFFFGSQTATVDTTVPLAVDLTARVVDIVHTENVTSEQLTVRPD